MTRPAGSVALTTLYLDNVLRVRHPPGRRPKGVQKCPRLRKYLNLQAEGGRFEPAGRRRPMKRASALEPLCGAGSRCLAGNGMASRNDPEGPSMAPSKPERFRLRRRSHCARAVVVTTAGTVSSTCSLT
jgi:hypothetical protein